MQEKTYPPESKSLALRCPRCEYPEPKEELATNPSPDRWFSCPSCGYKWSVAPIADS